MYRKTYRQLLVILCVCVCVCVLSESGKFYSWYKILTVIVLIKNL